jgi:N-glycosylase/DNA lyase
LHKAPHVYAGTAADLVAEVAPYITLSRGERWARKAKALFARTAEAAERAPHLVVDVARTAVERAPELAAKVREDLAIVRELRRKRQPAASPVADAAE